MVIVEKQNLLTEHRHQRALERMNRMLFRPRINRSSRPEWNSQSQILQSMDLSGMDRDVESDSLDFPPLFEGRLLQSVLGNISPRRSHRDSEFDTPYSPHRLPSVSHCGNSSLPSQRPNCDSDISDFESDVRIIPITFLNEKEKSDKDVKTKPETSLQNDCAFDSNSGSLEKRKSKDSPVIIIPIESSDDDLMDGIASKVKPSQHGKPKHSSRQSCVKSKADRTEGNCDDIVIIDEPNSIKKHENRTVKMFRSNKDTLVGGANKVRADIGGPDVYFASETMDIPVGAASGTAHDLDSDFDEEKPVNDVPNYPIYSFLKSKLKKECRQIDHIKGDGNCFFRALSKQLYGSERYHIVLRNLIVDLIATNKNKFAQFVDGEDVQDHVERMSQEQSWATTCEIYAAATLLQRDIFMLTPDHLNESYSWLLFKPVFKMDPQQCSIESHPCYITLCNTNGNHYDRIAGEHGGCNCFLPHPELEGINHSVDLTC